MLRFPHPVLHPRGSNASADRRPLELTPTQIELLRPLAPPPTPTLTRAPLTDRGWATELYGYDPVAHATIPHV